MPQKAKNASSIPLFCLICPKKTPFSDISHLLTHISSKSHLSCRFKIQLKAANDLEAKVKLDEFEDWYATYNMGKLLSERMNAKDIKKGGKLVVSKGKGSNPIKGEVMKREKRESGMMTLRSTPRFRAPVPPMRLFQASSDGEWDAPATYTTPSRRRPIPNFTETPSVIDPKLVSPLNADPTDAGDGDEEKGEKITDCLKLKGVHWPGMDLFDSATPEMKRLRNQKKDVSKLAQMKALSSEITPTEIVYSIDGEFQKERDIFGPLSCETSPTKIEVSPVKRAPRRTATKKADLNAPRLRARATKELRGQSPVKRHNPIRFGGYMSSERSANPLVGAGFGKKFNNEDDDFTTTFGKKRGFGVFQDTEISPVRTETSLEETSFDFPAPALPTYKSPENTFGSPTLAKTSSMRGIGKENGYPEAHHAEMRTAPQTYPSQVYYDPSYNPLYNPYGMNTYQNGYHGNIGYPANSYQLHGFMGRPYEDYRLSPGSSSFQGGFRPLSRSPTRANETPRPSNINPQKPTEHSLSPGNMYMGL
ncbi:hypothetical protein B0O99DRAFT_679935 [Bisporella sp. PMI_857]|nr:hypothetical protein B0O99DRAFT_679935 [Bisporella sp. PMI_857]